MEENTQFQGITEELGHGMFQTWYYDKKMFVLKGTRNTRSGADTWGQAMLEAMEMWDASQPFLVVHDFRAIGMTPYNRKVAIEISNQFPKNFFGHYTIIVDSGVIGYALKYFGERDLKRIMPQFEGRMLFDYDVGFKWVVEALEFTSNSGK